ncbi:MAG: glycyl-radical enzyme activating protein [Candidatus Heimdallarchaeota archaeon]|nr:MAG: glycyl-radical enzyme activating protein [Candidatus Heimdallarchaeota archaeon]
MKTKSKGVIFDIKKYALHDGPGIRTTVFLKGCPLNCWWCHNPEGQNPEPERIWNNQNTQREIIGREVSVDEVMAEIEKDLIFYDESNGGVTFSGGEPLMQPVFLDHLLIACQEQDLSTTLDTCGYASWETIERIKEKVDIFLYDLKMIDDTKHKKYTGVSVVPILSNLKKLDLEGKNIIIRLPVISGITDTEENISQLIKWTSHLQIVKEINLLPFHKSGFSKYIKLNRENKLLDLDPPSQERLDQLLDTFRSNGFTATIGG